MSASTLIQFSNELADIVAAASPAVVQVHGRGRPASGVIYAPEVVITTGRAVGREDGVRVRASDGSVHDAEIAGWDAASGIVVLRVPGVSGAPLGASDSAPRVGHVAVAVARSWSNALTASAGIVAVIGGPQRTGRRRSIEEIIRTTAPMHEGFAGGALEGPDGRLIGVTTAAAIRGLGVAIPARIAFAAAKAILEHGTVKRGYLGIAGQPVTLPESQRQGERSEGLLVVGVTPEGPAAGAGILVGDVLLDFDGNAVHSAEELLDLLDADRVGRTVPVRILRGASLVTQDVSISERRGH
jgi:S1-C subfamily serine protease